MNSEKKTTFHLHELKQGDIIILFNQTVAICIDSITCEFNNEIINITSIESDMYKVIREKYEIAKRNNYRCSLLRVSGWRKENRIHKAKQKKLMVKMKLG